VYPKVECALCVSKTVAPSERERGEKILQEKKVLNKEKAKKYCKKSLQKKCALFVTLFFSLR
jgi:hypothetical protein